jgi:hypothetical protein
MIVSELTRLILPAHMSHNPSVCKNLYYCSVFNFHFIPVPLNRKQVIWDDESFEYNETAYAWFCKLFKKTAEEMCSFKRP